MSADLLRARQRLEEIARQRKLTLAERQEYDALYRAEQEQRAVANDAAKEVPYTPLPAVVQPGLAPKPVPAVVQPSDKIAQRRAALLDAIAGKESAGKYNIGFGGTTITDMSKHPGQSLRRKIERGPNAGKTSSAAGRYQFMDKDWQEWSQKAGVSDFSPASQDAAAWEMAAATYGRKTGRSLDKDILSDDPAIIGNIGKSLSGRWTSLPGGIEATQSPKQFADTFFNSVNGTPTVANAGGTIAPQGAIAAVGPDGKPLPPHPNWQAEAGNITPEPVPTVGPMPTANAGVGPETDEQRQKRVAEGLELLKKQYEIGRQYQTVPIDMSNAKMGMAGLANPGYESVADHSPGVLQGLMSLLLSGKMGGQQEYTNFMGRKL